MPLICEPKERIILRDADGGLAAYQNSRQTDRWRNQVLAFNEVLSSAFIELDGKLIAEGDAVWVRDEDSEERRMVNGTATLSLHRVWNENWQRNGRLYGCWVQNLPKENRRSLLLNGEPVAEPDYPALHCRLIYDLAGKPMPDKPFEIDGFEHQLNFYGLLDWQVTTGRHGRGSIIQAPAGCGRARRRNAADGRRCKIVCAFLLQVTPDLPNPAEYETDRHRDRDCENHLQ